MKRSGKKMAEVKRPIKVSFISQRNFLSLDWFGTILEAVSLLRAGMITTLEHPMMRDAVAERAWAVNSEKPNELFAGSDLEAM